jgi:hypothetical protein
MAIQVITANTGTGTNQCLRRTATVAGTGSLNAKNPYTVIFRCYVSDSNPTDDFIWGLGNSNGGSFNFNRACDFIQESASGVAQLLCWISNSGTTSGSAVDLTTGWYTFCIVRSSSTALNMKMRIGTGTLNAVGGTCADNVATRSQESLYEWFFHNALTGNNMAAGSKIMNYKSWTRALSTAQCGAEDLVIDVQDTTNLFSVSPMMDEVTMANNITASGTAAAWSAGANLGVGTNDPAVTLPIVSGSFNNFLVGPPNRRVIVTRLP